MTTKNKIVINSILGQVIWESEKETLKEAVLEKYKIDADLRGADLRDADLRDAGLRGADLRDADLRGAGLRGAYLRGAGLRGADLRGADLTGAYLRGADLTGAYLRGADLRGADLRGADLTGADLRGAGLKRLPRDFINEVSRDLLFIFNHLKTELPFFKEKLLKGEIDGTQYEGRCACLVGTMANIKSIEVDSLCETIPFYRKGTHNPGENWFLTIRTGDTPENNEFAAHVLKLIEMVESGKIETVLYS
jgi:hypothetical protein